MFGLNRSRSKPFKLSLVKFRSAPRRAALKVPTMAKVIKALYDCLINLNFSPERADAFIDGEDTWELRLIKFVAYDEGLYGALQRAAR